MKKYHNNLKESKRLKEFFRLDDELLVQSKPMDYFEEGEGIYRVDYDAYVEEELFERILNTERLRLEYMYIFNSYSPSKALQEVENVSDDELQELVNAQLDNEECYVYYTTAEEEQEALPAFQKGEVVIYHKGSDYKLGVIEEVMKNYNKNKISYLVNCRTGNSTLKALEKNIYKIENSFAFFVLRKETSRDDKKETELESFAKGIVDIVSKSAGQTEVGDIVRYILSFKRNEEW